MNNHGPYELRINGKHFSWSKPGINGQELLDLTGLSPASHYELFFQVKDGLLEPVELTEEKQLKPNVPEIFEIRPSHEIKIELDDEGFPVFKCFMTPVEILDLLKLKASEYYLKKIECHDEISYKDDENHMIPMTDKSKFSSCKRGPTTVS